MQSQTVLLPQKFELVPVLAETQVKQVHVKQVFEFVETVLPGQMQGMKGISTRYDVPQTAVLEATGIALPPALYAAVPTRQIEYLAGRACAVEACRRAGLDPTPPSTGADREPVWPRGVIGSISHSHGRALALVAADHLYRSLGVDIEFMVEPEKAGNLFDMIATNAEEACLRPLTQGDRALAFTLIFCAKEAIFKSTWPLVRRFIDFDEVTLVSCAPGRLQFSAEPALAADLGFSKLPTVTFERNGTMITTLCWYSKAADHP